MSSPATPTVVTASSLWNTIKSDLTAGVSWAEEEVLTEGLAAWNYVKSVFIALAPQELSLAVTVLQAAVANAKAGDSIEQIWTSALNTTVQGELAILEKLGDTAGLQLIVGIKDAA